MVLSVEVIRRRKEGGKRGTCYFFYSVLFISVFCHALFLFLEEFMTERKGMDDFGQ